MPVGGVQIAERLSNRTATLTLLLTLTLTLIWWRSDTVVLPKLLSLLTRMQTKVDRLEEEISRTRSDIRAEMNNNFQQLTADLDELCHRCDENDKKIENVEV